MSKTKTAPARTARQTMLEEIESGVRPDPRENAFEDASRQMFDAVMAKIRWHHGEIINSLLVIDRDDPTVVEDALGEIRQDARDLWALSDLLWQAVRTAR